nr:unnamed protein product [Callosobruchus analis]
MKNHISSRFTESEKKMFALIKQDKLSNTASPPQLDLRYSSAVKEQTNNHEAMKINASANSRSSSTRKRTNNSDTPISHNKSPVFNEQRWAKPGKFEVRPMISRSEQSSETKIQCLQSDASPVESRNSFSKLKQKQEELMGAVINLTSDTPSKAEESRAVQEDGFVEEKNANRREL